MGLGAGDSNLFRYVRNRPDLFDPSGYQASVYSTAYFVQGGTYRNLTDPNLSIKIGDVNITATISLKSHVSTRELLYKNEKLVFERKTPTYKLPGIALSFDITCGSNPAPLDFHWLQLVDTYAYSMPGMKGNAISTSVLVGRKSGLFTYVPNSTTPEPAYLDGSPGSGFYDDGGSHIRGLDGSLTIFDSPTATAVQFSLMGGGRVRSSKASFDDYLVRGDSVYYHVHWEQTHEFDFVDDELIAVHSDIANVSGEPTDRLARRHTGQLIGGQWTYLVGYKLDKDGRVDPSEPIRQPSPFSPSVLAKWQ